MTPKIVPNPFDPRRYLGAVIDVDATIARINVLHDPSGGGRTLYGDRYQGGVVGQFVVIDAGLKAVLGIVVRVGVPERERQSLEPEVSSVPAAHPLASVQLVATIDLATGTTEPGIARYPSVGALAFLAQPALVAWAADGSQSRRTKNPIAIRIGSVAGTDIPVVIAPERLFGRHCAVLGATGGGKSWTVARLVEQVVNVGGKAILLDATGEYHTLGDLATHVAVGVPPQNDGSSPQECALPYFELSERDLFAMFRPSGQTQAPKLRAALLSLKVAAACGSTSVWPKRLKPHNEFQTAYQTNLEAVHRLGAKFDISLLSRQIDEECVWPSGRPPNGNSNTHGDWADNDRAHCIGLINRIDEMVNSDELAAIFRPGELPSLLQIVSEFIAGSACILRVSLAGMPFGHDAREILVNALGRMLLHRARHGEFLRSPTVVFLDEAHQFLNVVLGDENNKYALDSFALIAKEGRKFALSLCVATQRPRDLPDGVMSQVGTMIVHRLTNSSDRQVVERAAADADQAVVRLLPSLVPGEAALLGVDFPVPMVVGVSPPTREPQSDGPDYAANWHASVGPAE
ncbi:MAG: ATP-binding protein [Chloroflexota bacterium]